MKICTKCKESKELTEFYSHVKHGPRPECKVCSSARNAKNWKDNKKAINKKNLEWREANKDKLKIYSRKQELRRNFGITPETYDEMLKAQDGKCEICKKVYEKTLAVDHDHATGKIRDLLCNPCNTALGLLREDLDIVESMKSYIEKHKS